MKLLNKKIDVSQSVVQMKIIVHIGMKIIYVTA